MFIKRIHIKNFKCIGSDFKPIDFCIPNGQPGSGLNIFVGENNVGKSTIFEAVEFLRNYSDKELDKLRNRTTEEDFYVEMEFTGNVAGVIDSFSEKKLQDYIPDDPYLYFKTRRSSNIYKVKQGTKEVEITPKKVAIWNYKTNQFENPSGIDADFKKLFEVDFIWADTNPDEVTKFGATTVCGKLLGEIVKTFKTTKEYDEFSKAHQTAFNDPKSGLVKNLNDIKKRTNEIFNGQFNSSEIMFHFDPVDVDSFYKNAKIKINDGKIETYLDENGSGMQRSVALALLQVYAENLIKHPDKENISKPFYLFIDEPEICLHPQAQKRLLNALLEISKNQQVFITTHSPYFADPNLINGIYKFQVEESSSVVITRWADDIKLKQLKENNFLLRHRELFFTEKAIFVEGINDVELYSKFCSKYTELKDLPKLFFLMNGCDRVLFFEAFCKMFKINFFAIVDRDYSFEIPVWSRTKGREWLERFRRFMNERNIMYDEDNFNDQIRKSDEETVRKDDHEAIEVNSGNVSLLKVKDRQIFVLSKGEVKDYLDQNGEPRSHDCKVELEAIFNVINNSH